MSTRKTFAIRISTFLLPLQIIHASKTETHDSHRKESHKNEQAKLCYSKRALQIVIIIVVVNHGIGTESIGQKICVYQKGVRGVDSKSVSLTGTALCFTSTVTIIITPQ